MRKFSTHTQTEQAKRLRESGLSYRNIAKEMKIDSSIAYRMCTIPGYPNKTGNKRIDVDKAIELRKSGLSCAYIAKQLGCTRDAIYKNTSSKVDRTVIKKEEIKELRNIGLTHNEISSCVGISRYSVSKLISDNKVKSVKQRMPRKKKKVDAPQPMVDRYANLQKGLEKGVKEIVTTVRDDRDQGYTNSFKYKDEYSTKPITIFVKDGASREESANRWCEKNKKTFVNLI